MATVRDDDQLLLRWLRGRYPQLFHISDHRRIYIRINGWTYTRVLGHKVEAREIKIAALVTLLSPFLILAGTAIASYVFTNYGDAAWAVQPKNWLNNPGFHGFSEMLYEMTSSNANNGSGFEGLGDNNVFWNVATGFVLMLGRFLPIIGPIAIAGLLGAKNTFLNLLVH